MASADRDTLIEQSIEGEIVAGNRQLTVSKSYNSR